MAQVLIRPRVGFLDEPGYNWRIMLKEGGEERWLATLSDARLALRMARRYAEDNQAEFVPFDTESFEALNAMLKAVAIVPSDVAVARKALQDALAARAALCDRFRKKQRKRVVCKGCPIRESTGADNCKRLPFGLLKEVTGSPKAPIQEVLGRNLLAMLHAALMHVRDGLDGG